MAGGLLPAGPLLLLLALPADGDLQALAWQAAAAFAVSLGGVLLASHHVWGRAVAAAGVLGLIAGSSGRLLASPAEALAAALVAVLLLDRLSNRPALGDPIHPEPFRLVRAASTVALLSCGFVALPLTELGLLVLALAPATAAVAIAGAGLKGRSAIRGWKPFLLAAAVAAGLIAVAGGRWRAIVLASAIIPAAARLLLRPSGSARRDEWRSMWETLLDHPARMLVTTFLGLCAAGTVLLAAPAAAQNGDLHWLDAAFTSVSAVCVTGLIVVDTPTAFSLFGQASILLLIQLGGLGIMTFSTALLDLLGRRLSVRQEGAMASLVSSEDRSTLMDSLKRLLRITFVAEGAGAAALTLLFAGTGDPWPQAAWRGVFTAVSAFCNAGFALQTDSLIRYQQEPGILHVTAALIILGGLSPFGVSGLGRALRGRRVPLQPRVILAMTGALLVLGAVFIGLVEWRGALANLPWPDRLHNAWFQSATLRTAGFNSVDLTALQPAAVTLMMVWMFIGGSPGGTAGGVKVTAAAVLLLAVRAAIQGEEQIRAFGRRVPHPSVYRAGATVALGLATVFSALTALQLTQNVEAVSVAFEAVSAVATAGLSLGATAELDSVGKWIIMAAMFAGRVGPLTLFVVLAERAGGVRPIEPEEPLEIA